MKLAKIGKTPKFWLVIADTSLKLVVYTVTESDEGQIHGLSL